LDRSRTQAHTLALDQGGADAIAGLTSKILRTLGNGWGAVNVFFVISGFVLALSLARGPRAFVPSGTRFVVARLLRIYPAVFATIILFALVYWTTGGALTGPDAYEVTALIRNAFLLSTEIDGVMWSLQIELIAVPLIFAAFIMYRCWGTAPLVILLVSLAAMSFWGPWSHLLGRSIPLGILFSFIAGMVAFTSGRTCVQRVPSNLQPQLFVGAVLLFFLARPPLDMWCHRQVRHDV
jgi:peptidoglycan/LPS O-acetylase OafA/YrhL